MSTNIFGHINCEGTVSHPKPTFYLTRNEACMSSQTFIFILKVYTLERGQCYVCMGMLEYGNVTGFPMFLKVFSSFQIASCLHDAVVQNGLYAVVCFAYCRRLHQRTVGAETKTYR